MSSEPVPPKGAAAASTVPSSRGFARTQLLAALTKGDLATAALIGQRLSRFTPPHADDLLLAAVARLQAGDSAVAGDLLDRALTLDPHHVMSAKALARIGLLGDKALAALAWNAEADAEAAEILRLHAGRTGAPVAFIANRGIRCAVPPAGGRLTVEWSGHLLGERLIPPAAAASLVDLPWPDSVRGTIDPLVFLDGATVPAPALRGIWLSPPRLAADVRLDTNGELLIRALDRACPERPLTLLLLDGDRLLVRLPVQPPPGCVADDLDDLEPQRLVLPAVARPRLLFDLTGEPLALPVGDTEPLPVAEPVVDVIVPVHGDLAATSICFERLLSCDPGAPMRVIAIDDRGPDPAIATLLDGLAAAGRIVLRRNPANLGFVRSVNIGMAMDGARDVVLLNADTVVVPGWLRRLRDAAYRTADTGTVTPWSNDATICSYPRANAPTPLGEVDVQKMDGLASAVLAGCSVDIPTAVGFCMYIRRDCLRRTGWFDADTFGTGYGEENDFCQRASRLGWRHVMALDLYVGHVGGGSFGPAKQARIDRALRRLALLYPDYEPSIHAFIQADPLGTHRRALDRARLFAQGRQRPFMVVCARLGGGTERFITQRLAARPGAGNDTVLLRPGRVEGQPLRLFLELPDRPDLGNLIYDPATDLELLWSDLSRLGVVEMELHHLFHLTPDTLRALVKRFAYRVHLHDYSWICPRITLTGGDERYCGEPALAACETCVSTHGDLLDTGLSVTAWRALTVPVLEGAQRVECATREAMARLRRHVPAAPLHLVPVPPEGTVPIAFAVPRRQPGEVLRLVVPGAIGPPKGFQTLLDCARDVVARQLPLRFHVIGYSLDDDLLVQTGAAMVTGRYEEEEFPQLLAEIRPHGALIPSHWPETWCYALSHVLAAGLPTAAFDIGAQAERLRDQGRGMLMPLGLPAATINNALLAFLPDR
jgi:GT2 family glycosyltransferase/glycosyltransferase involved in cell wall biosynthesis